MARQFSLPGLEAPNTPLIISAFIKSIRLRRTEDAIGWLRNLWSFPSLRHRVTRRILISSGEDSMSPELVAVVARWFGGPHRYSYRHAASEVCRICATPSWWALPEGHRMMFAWLRAETIAERLSVSSMDSGLAVLGRAVQMGSLLGGLGIFTRLSVLPDFTNLRLVEDLSSHVEQTNDSRATNLFDCWRGLSPVLGRDTNISGMLLFMLLGGELPRIAVPSIDPSSVQLTANCLGPEWGAREPPSWANDGIHAQGDGPQDPRFAGVLRNFIAMANAYAHYGRLSPDDAWLPEFFRLPD
jgi:hypothetical protein